MPHSKNPINYEDFFWDLLSALDSTPNELVFELPANQAQSMRHRTYRFLYALETEAEKLKKAGDLVLSGERQREANRLRNYKMIITIGGHTRSLIKTNDHTPAELRFVNRDLTELNLSLKEQLAKQMNGKVKPRKTEEELPELLPPTLDEFFNSPLETPDGEAPELNADGPENTPSDSSESSS